jgi:carboxypeptidase T
MRFAELGHRAKNMKKIIFLAFILCLLLSFVKAQDDLNKEIISIEKNQEIEKKLREMKFDFLMEHENRVYLVVGFDEISTLQKENIPYIMETQNFSSHGQKEISIQGGVNGDYHSYKELERDLLALQDSYPGLAQVFTIGESLEGRNIYAMKISDNVSQDEVEPEVLFIGCHHAREWISVEVPYLLGKYLLENYGTDSRVKSLVDASEIWIIPLLNPDGLEYSIHFYRYWRKNRRDNGDGTYGIDINRNYGYQWGFDNIGSSPETYSETYRGPSPFSEPETQAIRDLFSQRNFKAMISYHSYSQDILYPWGYTSEPTDEDSLMAQIAAEMSRLIKSVNGNDYVYGQSGNTLYLTNGDTTDWAFANYGIPAYTIELPPMDILQGGFFNAEKDIQSIFNENVPAALYLIEWSIDNFDPINLPENEEWEGNRTEKLSDRMRFRHDSQSLPKIADERAQHQIPPDTAKEGVQHQNPAPKAESAEISRQPALPQKKDTLELFRYFSTFLFYLLRLF